MKESLRIDLSKVAYAIVIAIVLMLGSCKRQSVAPYAETKSSSSSLEELLDEEFYCFRAEYPDSNTYHFNVPVNNEFLAAFNSPPSEFDLNDDQHVNTLDVLLNLSGFGNPQPEHPSLADFTPFQTFGEGNTWLTYTGSDSNISFGWMHRTPYDESNAANYSGYEDIYTWTLDVVTFEDIIYYYFVQV
mgnify:FL=1